MLLSPLLLSPVLFCHFTSAAEKSAVVVCKLPASTREAAGRKNLYDPPTCRPSCISELYQGSTTVISVHDQQKNTQSQTPQYPQHLIHESHSPQWKRRISCESSPLRPAPGWSRPSACADRQWHYPSRAPSER